MSETIFKRKLLDAMNNRINWFFERSEAWRKQGVQSKSSEMCEAAKALEEVKADIESGRFDAPDVARLRAALELAMPIVEHQSPTRAEMIREALSATTEQTGPFTVRRDERAGISTAGKPFAVAIERDGYTLLHLQPGTERNEENIEWIVALLNANTTEPTGTERVSVELRKLIDGYIKRQERIGKEIKEAKNDGDVEAELIGEALYKQMRHIIAELFQTMKNLGVLDEKEIEFGCVKDGINAPEKEGRTE